MTNSIHDTVAQIRTLLDLIDPPAPAAAVTPVGVTDSALRLVWRDEFDASSLDATKWREGPIWAAAGGAHGYNSTEKGWYAASQVSVANSNAVLTAEKKVGGENLPYTTGTITTAPDKYGVVKKDWKYAPATLDFTYGFVEARIKLPKGKGLWPAFWLVRSDEVWPPEIDILEVVDPTCHCVAEHYHYGSANTDFTAKQGLGFDTGIDLSQDFHTFGLNWQADRIEWYIDGNLGQTFTDVTNIANKPMYIILNLAVGGSWPGDPDSSTVFPAHMLIDYVRVWQK